jgi:hypothetical protein
VLLWLSFASRPLTLIELSEAVVLDEGDTTLNQDARLRDPQVLLEICHGFLEYDAATGQAKIAHASVREYLLSDYTRHHGDAFFSFETVAGHRSLMRKCITYLMFDDFKSEGFSNVDLYARSVREFPLLDYAARCWTLHASYATVNECDLADEFFSTTGNYQAWVSWLQRTWNQHDSVHSTTLHVAASHGLISLIRSSLARSMATSPEQPRSLQASTPLQDGFFFSHHQVAKMLVAEAPEFWKEDPGGGKFARFWARSNDWKYFVDRMVRLRAEIPGQVQQKGESRLQKYWGRFKRPLSSRRTAGHGHTSLRDFSGTSTTTVGQTGGLEHYQGRDSNDRLTQPLVVRHGAGSGLPSSCFPPNDSTMVFRAASRSP